MEVIFVLTLELYKHRYQLQDVLMFMCLRKFQHLTMVQYDMILYCLTVQYHTAVPTLNDCMTLLNMRLQVLHELECETIFDLMINFFVIL